MTTDTRTTRHARGQQTGRRYPAWGRAGTRRAAAFSLMEVLVALGIFAVGLVAVAAIFPTAITIQRDTVREADGRRIAKNAKSILLATARTNSASGVPTPDEEMSLNPGSPPSIPASGSLLPFLTQAIGVSAYNNTPVMPMIDLPLPAPPRDPLMFYTERSGSSLTVDAPASFHWLLNPDTRSYPQNIDEVNQRDYYWYPLLKVADATTTPVLSVYIVVMHRDGTDLPPEIRQSFPLDATRTTGNEIFFNANGLFNDGTGDVSNDPDGDGLPDFIQPGDIILGNDGRKHRVILARADSLVVDSPNVGNPTAIYFGVAIDSANFIKREARSPIVWIEDDIPLSINNP